MSDEEEVRRLMEELERLTGDAETNQVEADAATNQARQTEIRARLAALGRPVA